MFYKKHVFLIRCLKLKFSYNTGDLMNDSVLLSKSIRKAILKISYQAKTSHIGGALSVADILAVLYANILHYDSQKPEWEGRDRLLYSKGHACSALYAVLCEVGFYNQQSLDTFCQNGSIFTSHISHHVPGVELSTGSLGHALSIGCGMSLAAKRKKENWRVFVILSDGELNEGSNWEAILFAPNHNLDNLSIIIDYNKYQGFGTVKDVLEIEPIMKKFEAFGWATVEINGHNHSEIYNVLSRVPNTFSKPTAIIAHTIKGKGVSFMENQLAWHYKSINGEQIEQAMLELDEEG